MDRSMCVDRTCTLRVKCLRYRATPSRWQSYMGYKQKPDGSCPDFLDIADYPNDRIELVEDVDRALREADEAAAVKDDLAELLRAARAVVNDNDLDHVRETPSICELRYALRAFP